LEQGSYGSHKGIGKDIHAKSVGIPEYYLRGNVEFHLRSMEESGIRISSISKDLNSKLHTEI
jgi:hypothetical protein